MNAPAAIIPPYRHTPLFPLGQDTAPYRKLGSDGVRVEKLMGARHAGGRARGPAHARRGRLRRHQSSAAARASRPAARDPGRPGGEPERQVRRLRLPQERQYRGRRRAAHVPGHRHRHHHGQEGPAGVHRRRRRGGARGRRARFLPQAQSALLAAGADLHVRGEEHALQHAGAGRDLCRRPGRRGRLQVPVHRQGRRLRQQVVPVPGDARRSSPTTACSPS